MYTYPAFRLFSEQDQVIGRISEVALEEPLDGQVLIKVRYSSVNYKDALVATGRFDLVRAYPVTAGLDAAGTVVATRDTRFREGDEVIVTGYGMGTERDGGFAGYLRVPADWVVAKPAALTLFEAMAIGTAGFTAALGLMRLEENGLNPARGEVAITGATGGVGSLAVDILAACGYSVAAITGKSDRMSWLQDLGARRVIQREECQNLPATVDNLFAGALDAAGGPMLPWLLDHMQVNSAIATFGVAAGAHLDTSLLPFVLRGISLLGLSASNCPMKRRESVWQHLAIDMRPRHLRDLTHTTSLEGLPESFDRMLRGESCGHTVVVLPD